VRTHPPPSAKKPPSPPNTMRSTLSLIRREFTAYFWSPVAYVVLGVFLLGLGLLFHLTLQKLTARGPVGTEFPMQDLLGNVGFWLIFWVIPPLLTMRLFAEERSTGTLEMLMTAPLRDGQVVLCKFLACYLFFGLLLLPTVLYLPLLLNLHGAHGHVVFGIGPGRCDVPGAGAVGVEFGPQPTRRRPGGAGAESGVPPRRPTGARRLRADTERYRAGRLSVARRPERAVALQPGLHP